MNALKSIGKFLSIISGIALIMYIYRFFTSASKIISENEFPKASEKVAAEKKVEEVKKEIKEVKERTYTDYEIEKKFNE